MRKFFLFFLFSFFVFIFHGDVAFASSPTITVLPGMTSNHGVSDISAIPYQNAPSGDNYAYYQGSYTVDVTWRLKASKAGLYNLDGTLLSSIFYPFSDKEYTTPIANSVAFGLPNIDILSIPDGLGIYFGSTYYKPIANISSHNQIFYFNTEGGTFHLTNPDTRLILRCNLSNSCYIPSTGEGVAITLRLTFPVVFHQPSTALSFNPYIYFTIATNSSTLPPYQKVVSSYISETSNSVVDELQKQHQEEVDKAEETNSSVNSGVTQITGVLSSWEIFTMPFTLLKDLYNGLTETASTSITFPSYSVMGYQIWDSYTFDLETVSTNFPLVTDSLHVVTGVLVVGWFVHYLHRKWATIVGDDMPDDE